MLFVKSEHPGVWIPHRKTLCPTICYQI